MSLPSGVSARPVFPGARILQGSSQGYVIAIISAILLAFTAIIIRVLTEYYHLPTFVLAFWRAALVALVLLPALLLFKPEWARLRRSQIPFYAGYGLLLAVFNSLWTLSVALNGASVATILTYCSVGFTVFLGWMIYSERLNLRQLVVIVVSLGGCFLVSNGDSMGNSHFNLLGLLVGMLSGIGYTLYTLGGRVATERHYPVWNTILYVFGFSAVYQWLFNAALTFYPLAAFHGMTGSLWFLSEGVQGIEWRGWLLLLTLAAGPTLLGFGLYNISLKTLPLAVANLILSLELVFTAVIAYFLLGENMNQLQLLGSALVLGGVLMLKNKTVEA
ncbi:DMT family transporter [Serratia quinivorans]|uniref:DMT family transporter n=1 Tax=Serratia quinivorans TaxID=137545 RepID=UPI00217AB0B8|nr:DMT family transporter [Serratia quinivorans]CAI0705991.1 Inner membrane transporter rhtA [Serratia quinivorans]CAI0706801.1 Inner membrane transporter rhtA [Serratia quinivorans]CAI0733868.1 Inner membrane transporter rhtA [Serratia quinivorans]CAI1642494.1 Inner membrane transporter rhtA [Serratia quinivorans]CAI2044497.1 Inner membrane transporter rhtA [Serratia quinivorans]